jgi:hypothetical protein
MADPTPGAPVPPDALATFTEWFCCNYPGPDTIIHKPEWHAPKVFRAAQHAINAQAIPERKELAELLRELESSVMGLAYECQGLPAMRQRDLADRARSSRQETRGRWEMNQIDQFTAELDQLIDRYRGELGLTYVSMIGALHLTIHDLCIEAAEGLGGGSDG